VESELFSLTASSLAETKPTVSIAFLIFAFLAAGINLSGCSIKFITVQNQ
jgi:hypothetical protein